MKAINIIWDTDGEDVALPTEIEIPDGMTDEEEISDYISDETGFCHMGYELEYVDITKKEQIKKDLRRVKRNGKLLQRVENQTPKICLEAVKQNGLALEYVKKQTPELCMEAVKQNGLALEFVKNQTPELCMEAVKQKGWALEYVKDQTPEICLEAVKQNGNALYYVKEQTPEICLEAVKQNGRVLKYVKNQTPEICLEAVKQNGRALEYVHNQSLELCVAAVIENKKALKYVDDVFYDDVFKLIENKALYETVQEKYEKETLVFIFDDGLNIDDKLAEVDGYVWATGSLVKKLKEQLGLTEPSHMLDTMENINFYPVYNVNDKTVRLTGSYDIHAYTGWDHRDFIMSLNDDEKMQLKLTMDEYCQAEYDVGLDDFIDEIGLEEGLSTRTSSSELKTFKIPVMYMNWGLIDVKADNLEEAVKFARENIDKLPLPSAPEYVEDSYEIDYEGIELHNREENKNSLQKVIDQSLRMERELNDVDSKCTSKNRLSEPER